MNKQSASLMLIAAGAIATLVVADQFFLKLASPDSKSATMTIASGGIMLSRRSMSLVCSESGDIRLLVKARLAERDLLESGVSKSGAGSLATILIGPKQLRAPSETISIETTAVLIDKNWIDTIQTGKFSQQQANQIVTGLSASNAEQISFLTMERGIFLDTSTTSTKVGLFISQCSSRAASAS